MPNNQTEGVISTLSIKINKHLSTDADLPLFRVCHYKTQLCLQLATTAFYDLIYNKFATISLLKVAKIRAKIDDFNNN